MKTITTNNRTLLFLEVPEDAKFVTLLHSTCEVRIQQSELLEDVKYIQLPFGVYVFVADTKTISNEQLEPIIIDWDGSFSGTNFSLQPLIQMAKAISDVSNISYQQLLFKSLLKHHSITGRHAIIEVL